MKKKNTSGFTLLELVIYTAIFASVAGLLTSILVSTTKVTTNQTVTTQVSNELNLLLSTVQDQVRSSSNIDCVGASQLTCSTSITPGSYLKLRFEDPTKDPTCIYLSGTQILLAQGPDSTNPQNCTSTTQALTTSKVNATSLTFTKYDFPGGHATVQIDATLAYNSTNPDMQISRSLHSAIGRVSAATFDSDLLPDLTNSRSIGTSIGPKTWKNVFLSGGLVTPKISPSTDSITAVQITKADALTTVLNIDTTNGNVGVGTGANAVNTLRYFDIYNNDTGNSDGVDVRLITPNASGTISAGLVDLVKYKTGAFVIGNNETSATGAIAFNIGVSERMRIDSSGNVGINTTTPGAKLQVNSGGVGLPPTSGTTVSPGEVMRLRSTDAAGGILDIGSGTNQFWFQSTDATGLGTGYQLLLNPNGGNVGIGTTSPTDVLSVAGVSMLLAGNNPRLRLQDTVTGGTTWRLQSNVAALGDVGFYDEKNARTPFVINNLGNVGIGTTTPGAKLDVTNAVITTDTQLGIFGAPGSLAGVGYVTFGGGFVGWDYTSGGIALNAHSAGGSNGGIFVKGINSGASVVGIGTKTPGTRLHIKQSADSAIGGIRIERNADTNSWEMWDSSAAYLTFSYNTSPVMTLANNGSVGIGTTSPTTALQVVGTITGTVKNFEINDPIKPGYKLLHSTLEGPEIAVFYRGEAQLESGKAVVILPDYFEALTRKEGRTVLLTPKFSSDSESISQLAASSVREGRFAVRAINSNNPNQKFYWEVKAVRNDVAPLVVEKKTD